MIFEKCGIQQVGVVFKKKDCQTLLKAIHKTRDYKNLFLSKKVWLSKKWSFLNQNPSPGRNLLDKLETKFIFDNDKLSEHMSTVLGKKYRIIDAKLIMSVPPPYIPTWILELKKNSVISNLGEFIKPLYRDITYFSGIDFHQDIIDWPTRGPDFITGYIYLDDVKNTSSPIFVVPNSHKLGANTFPHKIKYLKRDKLKYTVTKNSLNSKFKVLSGKAGSLFYWHPFTLHGTQSNQNQVPRTSIRLLVEKKERIITNCLLDKVNKKIFGKKRIIKTRSKALGAISREIFKSKK